MSYAIELHDPIQRLIEALSAYSPSSRTSSASRS
jgi:hypothetical protein